MSDEKRKTKGKLLFNDYQSPKYDRMRRANKLMKYGSGILTIIGLSSFLVYPNQITAGLFIYPLCAFVIVFFLERSYRNSISVYDNGLEVECGKPRGGGSSWSVGRKFIPFSEIKAIGHRTDIGKPIKEADNLTLGILLVEIKVRNKDYIGHIPPTSLGDVLPILEKHFGPEWKNIYDDPFKDRTEPATNS